MQKEGLSSVRRVQSRILDNLGETQVVLCFPPSQTLTWGKKPAYHIHRTGRYQLHHSTTTAKHRQSSALQPDTAVTLERCSKGPSMLVMADCSRRSKHSRNCSLAKSPRTPSPSSLFGVHW
ncbi:hypothetical protein DL546_001056 [Coniochaeta pulveracea]|uniref:Uncharacterized protein n=1 Tax=Coniochaeta pulveracea TaxID=177199 RepID=A0A420Y330_9PEZI|nr:hypothetical protein DL546_001056 [Coniochaeta pulveracea]